MLGITNIFEGMLGITNISEVDKMWVIKTSRIKTYHTQMEGRVSTCFRKVLVFGMLP